MRRLELRDPEKHHNKFWEVSDPEGLGGGAGWLVTCRWGRIGSDGQWKDFFFKTYAAAEKFRCDKIEEKKAKGYTSHWPTASSSPSPTVFLHVPMAPASPQPEPADPFSLPFD